MSKTAAILKHLADWPTNPVKDVCEKFDVTPSYVYTLRKKMKNEAPKRRAAQVTMEPDETNVDQVLDSRAKDYGKFIEGAEIMQMLKRLVHNYIEDRGTPLAFDQREAIDMIIHKLGRIINGNPDKVDHWVDIAGYAKLVAERLEGNAR
jgi:hypothetical protein